MKNWYITGLFSCLIFIFLLSSGCTDAGPTGPVPAAAITPQPQIVYVTVLVTPAATIPPIVTAQAEDTEFIKTQLNSKWRKIQVAYDTFNETKNKLRLTTDEDINQLRQTDIPAAIAQYQGIRDELLQIKINNNDLQSDRAVLVSICDYKIKFLEGLGSAYHASQTETYPDQTSLTEYKNARYRFQDVRDIISGIPYSSKYWDYVHNDDQSAKANIVLADQNIIRLNSPVK
jgi:hypothetical protein